MKALFTSLPAADYMAGKDFYENSLGLTVLREFEGGPRRATNHDLGGLVLKIFEWTEAWCGTGHSDLFIETDRLDEVVERIRERGGKTFDTVVHPWGSRCCTVGNPFGNLFDLIDANMKRDA